MRWGFWPRYGLAFIRLRGYFYTVKAPWCRPLWSERQGITPPLAEWRGWRILKKKVGD